MLKIDLVYLWCNDQDPVWRAKRLASQAQQEPESSKNQDSTEVCRFIDNDELMYSLRSVEMYAPWINKIFIVTDNQKPEWLDGSNPKIRLVDHSELFKPEELPIFSSIAIEQRIAYIKDLSECFLYANDDMMFNRPTDPSFFFKSDGKAYARLDHLSPKRYIKMINKGQYGYTVNQVIQRIKADFGLDFTRYVPLHQIDAYNKSSMLECLEYYKEWSDATISHPFRQDDDMQRHIFALYGLANKHYSPKYTIPSIWKKMRRTLLKKLHLKPKPVARYFSLTRTTESILEDCKKLKPHLICFNDNERTTDEDRERASTYLPILYPTPSSFELKEKSDSPE